MHRLTRIFDHAKHTNTMDRKNPRRKPKLERRNALKYSEYDAGSSSSSLDDSSGSLYTRSMEVYDRTSFRIEGVEGEFDRICRSLGLSGPEDFAIPAAAWEAMKFRSSSDILPRLKLDIQEEEQQQQQQQQQQQEPEIIEEIQSAEEGELRERYEDRVRVRDIECCTESGGGGGIKGIRPPMLKPPPGVRVQVVDDACSTWDLFRDLAPQGEVVGLNHSEDEREVGREKENGEEVGKESPKREGEEVVDNAARIAEIVAGLSESCSFSTSNEDDSSSSTTDPRSNNISPNGRIKRIIIAGSWQKGEFLGGGSFGSVYEGISE